MPELYVVLVEAQTFLGRTVRRFSTYPYTHIAISFDLQDFYSFSRHYHYLPFAAGFMIEHIEHYAYGKFKDVNVRIYRQKINEETKRAISDYTDSVRDDVFDIYSLITMPIFHGFHIPHAHNCMSFVAEVLEIAHLPLQKPSWKYNIPELEALMKQSNLQYIDKTLQKEKEDPGYMRRFPITRQISTLFHLNGQLIKRIFTEDR